MLRRASASLYGHCRIRPEVLFDAFRYLIEDGGGYALDINYGEDVEDEQEMNYHLWVTIWGYECLIFNPVNVKALNAYLGHLLLPLDSKGKKAYNVTGDPFSILPAEVLLDIASHIDDVAELAKLRVASPGARTPCKSCCSRKSSFEKDMSWLWEVADLMSSKEGAAFVDWGAVYRRIWRGT